MWMLVWILDSRHRAARAVVSIFAALCLVGCGGGGGGSGDTSSDAGAAAAGGTASTGPAAGAAPQAAPITAAPVVLGAGKYALAPNTAYLVDAQGEGEVTLTLPSQLEPGDAIHVRGQGTGRWRIAQGAGQAVETLALPGAVSWQDVSPVAGIDGKWWALALSADGATLAAVANEGQLHVSHDGGASWLAPMPEIRNWSAVAVSAQGDTLVASAFGGSLWVSRDGGASWQATQAPSGDGGGAGREWIAVAVSSGGQFMIAAEKLGDLHVSQDFGQTWTPRQQVREWRAVAMAGDGMNITAVTLDGTVWTSDDLGFHWNDRLAGTVPWYRVAMSQSGQSVVAATSGGFVYTSSDWGIGWQPRWREGPVNAVAISADGRLMALAVPWHDSLPDGRIQISSDGGQTWRGFLDNANWRAVAMSGDGTRVVAGANTGRLWLSKGLRTTRGEGGAITGGAGDAVELVYLGDGLFAVRSAQGSGFTVQ